jgi:hypothetical protein
VSARAGVARVGVRFHRLDEVAEAHRAMEADEAVGKRVVVVP